MTSLKIYRPDDVPNLAFLVDYVAHESIKRAAIIEMKVKEFMEKYEAVELYEALGHAEVVGLDKKGELVIERINFT